MDDREVVAVGEKDPTVANRHRTRRTRVEVIVLGAPVVVENVENGPLRPAQLSARQANPPRTLPAVRRQRRVK